MTYPEPIPVLKGKAAKRFLKDLENFKLSDEQKKFYREAIERFRCKDDCMGHWKIGYCNGCIRNQPQVDKYSQKKCKCTICEPE